MYTIPDTVEADIEAHREALARVQQEKAMEKKQVRGHKGNFNHMIKLEV